MTMKRWNGKSTILAGALCLVHSAALGAELDTRPEIVVVTHTSIPLESVGKKELTQLFLGLRTSIGKVRLSPLDLAATELRQGYLERLTGMSWARLEEHYMGLVLRGEGRRPPRVGNAKDVARLAFEVKRVIAWLPRSEFEGLDARQRAVLKVLAVDGKKPGEDKYLFRAK